MTEQDKQELAKAIVELISKDERVRQAVWDCACCCPNLTV
jgi:hypothetical protein